MKILFIDIRDCARIAQLIWSRYNVFTQCVKIGGLWCLKDNTQPSANKTHAYYNDEQLNTFMSSIQT